MINGAAPYIWFRNHKERIVGKKLLERIIPRVDPLLGLFADYLNRADLNRNEPIFPTYGGGRHSFANRSKKLSKHIVNMRSGFDNSQLSPYSLQHTFKDRAVVAGVPSSVTEYFTRPDAKRDLKQNHKQQKRQSDNEVGEPHHYLIGFPATKTRDRTKEHAE